MGGTRRNWKFQNWKFRLTPYLFLLPNILIFSLFIIVPAVRGLWMSFWDWGVFTDKIFVGFGNFKNLSGDSIFWITFRNTIVYSFFVVLLLIIVALALAMVLYREKLCGKRIFRAAFYIPSLMSMITVGIAWRFILGDEMGLINYLIRLCGGKPVSWLTNGTLAMLCVIVVSVWMWAGYYMIIFISGLQAIPDELYEAARIDGASAVSIFFKITLPLLKPTTLVVMILSTINAFKAYELISVMTKGGPGYATKFIVQQVYQVAFVEDRMGYASAMAIVLMLLIGVFTLLQFKVSGREQDYE